MWARRIVQPVLTLRRFWVNIQVAQIITQKPVNVRMGKGKGGRKGVAATIQAGTTLVGFSALRLGLLQVARTRVQVRCNFKVLVACMSTQAPDGFVGHVQTWLSTRCLQPRYTTTRLDELLAELAALRRPVL